MKLIALSLWVLILGAFATAVFEVWMADNRAEWVHRVPVRP